MKTEIVQEDQILKFQKRIEEYVSTGMTYIEALVHYCEVCDIEPSTIKRLISESILSEVNKEAIEQRLIKSTSTFLPI